MGRIFLLTTFISFSLCGFSSRASSQSNAGWVEGRLQEMTLKEKIGQMMMVGIYGDRITPSETQYIVDNHIGNIILFDRNITDEDQLKGMTDYMQEAVIQNTGIPLTTATDQEGGLVSRIGKISGLKYTRHSANTLGKAMKYAPKRARAALYNASLTLAERMKALGLNMNLAPVLDLAPKDNSYIFSRSFGAKPSTVVEAAKNIINALHTEKIIATGKHFPNLGYSTEDSHLLLPVINRSVAQLQSYEFQPFVQLRDDVDVVMVGHVLVPQIDKKYPASISKPAIDILRKRVGFNGVIISDDLKMKALTDTYTVPEIGIRATLAGIDILLAAYEKDQQLQLMASVERAVMKGIIPRKTIDDSVRRILNLKYKYLKESDEED